ncbi:MAG: hypothetical protein KDE10_11055 [Rhodobacteraceae bacterium]|nr:hypothetical protein [Paracoccaceae bacterium]
MSSNRLPARLPEPGPLLEYLQWLRSSDVQASEKARLAIRSMLSTSDGAMFMELLEKAVLYRANAILGDSRALEARNAQGLIAFDLRRIASDEHEQLLERQTNLQHRRSRSGRDD